MAESATEVSKVLSFMDTMETKGKEEQLQKLGKELFEMPLDFSNTTPEILEKYYNQLEKLYLDTYAKIADLSKTPEKISFDSVVQAMIDVDLFCMKARAICAFMKQVSTDKKVRDTSTDIGKKIEKLLIQLGQDEAVYKVFEIYYNDVFSKNKEKLDLEQMRFVDKTMRNYRRNGLCIKDPKVKEEIKLLKEKMTDLKTQFCDNVREDKTHFFFTKEELEGLPDSWFEEYKENKEKEQAKEQEKAAAAATDAETKAATEAATGAGTGAAADETGKFKVTLKYTDVFPVMDFVKNREVRRKIFTAFDSRCIKENTPIFKEILRLRDRHAKLLGYKNHADYATEIKMSKNGDTVAAFQHEMNERFTPLFERNLKELTEFARAYEKDSTFTLELPDMRYYMRLHSEATYNIDMEKIKQYFPIKRTVDKTLNIYENLLGLKFKEVESKEKWHEEARCFEVYNNQTEEENEKIGTFYLDLHPRDGKYYHAAVFDLLHNADISHITKPGDKLLPVCGMLCNFPKTGGLSFKDFKTFFHEFGHVMHTLCSKTKLADFNGFEVEWDFVEAPSQMLEFWCYEDKVLKLISQNPETGEPLPSDVAVALDKSEKQHAGYLYKRQLVYGTLDFQLHCLSEKEIEELDLIKYTQDLQKRILTIAPPPSCFTSSFTHLAGGYDAGYYGYLYSETFAADMYDTIFRKDPLSKEAGAWYRKCILDPGSSQDAMVLLTEFLGRPPKMDAFLEECGLEAHKKPEEEDQSKASASIVKP